jgi:prevent-host-death family protein
MIEVGVRELRDNLSEYLRRVSRGEHLRVTMHGRPVADVTPAGMDDRDRRFRDLAAQARVSLPTAPPPDHPPMPVRASRSASQLILDERDSER